MATSQAVSSQGTEIQVETGAGTPLTITAITKADPAVVTSANTLDPGDVVKFATVVGMVEMNAQGSAVGGPSATAFDAASIDSTNYTTYVSGGTATPVIFSNNCEIKTFTGFDGQGTEIDVTTLCSEAKEYRVGLQDFGSFNFSMNYVPTDPAQLALQNAKAAGAKLWYRLSLPVPFGDWVFEAYVRQMTISGGVDQVLTSDVVLRITGAPVYVEPEEEEVFLAARGQRVIQRAQQQPQPPQPTQPQRGAQQQPEAAKV